MAGMSSGEKRHKSADEDGDAKSDEAKEGLGSYLSVNCETQKTELSVLDFEDYMPLKRDRRQASKPQHTPRFCNSYPRDNSSAG